MTWDIFGKCDCCCDTNLKGTSLSDQQHPWLVIVKSQEAFKQEYINYEEVLLRKIPKHVYKICMIRTASFSKNILKSCVLKRNVNGNMQTDPHDTKEGEIQDENRDKQQKHEYNCDCNECQIKFGSLPLLVQVIEGQEKASLENFAANLSTPQSSRTTPDLNEPSTSSSSSSNPKKTMNCPHCNKVFTHRGDFNKHVRKHTGEQPYTCTICKRKFAHTSNLNRHLRVHSGDRPFVCDICNRNFSRKDKLDLHKKTKLCKKIGQKKS